MSTNRAATAPHVGAPSPAPRQANAPTRTTSTAERTTREFSARRARVSSRAGPVCTEEADLVECVTRRRELAVRDRPDGLDDTSVDRRGDAVLSAAGHDLAVEEIDGGGAVALDGGEHG